MEVHGVMGSKVSTCLYIDRGVLEAARRVGLNVPEKKERGAACRSVPHALSLDVKTGQFLNLFTV
jgi:hypothetical protein